MDELLPRHRQRQVLRLRADDAAVAGADIDHLWPRPHLQQGHAAVQVLQQPAQRDGAHGAELPARPLLRPVLVLQAIAVLAGLFRLVERQVRGLIEPLELLPARGEIDAHAGRDVHHLAVAQRQVQLVADLRRLFAHVFLGDITAEENGEFVAAQAADDVVGAEKPGEDARRLPDGLVAGLVAQRVVHLLEIVQVDDEQRALLLRRHLLQTLFYVLLHRRPVQKPGHGVLARPLLQLLQLILQPFFVPRDALCL